MIRLASVFAVPLIQHARFSYGFVLPSTPFVSLHRETGKWRAFHDDELPFDACWDAQSVNVNPSNDSNIEVILQRLCSPAPQSYFVVERARKQGAEHQVETLRQLQYLLKQGYRWATSDDSREIEVVSIKDDPVKDGWQILKPLEQQSALEMSHDAVDLASCDLDYDDLQDLVAETKKRINLTLGTDIRGRASADAAFSFAMAGVADQELYQMLAIIACKELERVGRRPSFRSKYILQMVEKLAAAGIGGHQKVFHVAAECLQFKGEHADVVEQLLSNQFDLLSTRPLLWIWRFSSKQSKVQPFMMPDRGENSGWMESFDDPSRSLIVDLGCGMGVSLLGLTRADENFAASSEGELVQYNGWKDSNLVGCDASTLNLGFGRGISKRWSLDGHLQYVCSSAEQLLDDIDSSYKGRVPLIMIQFPSPFRFRGKSEGNSQLPEADTFMVSGHLLRTAARILDADGLLLIQSNVEDVAVSIRDAALEAGFENIAVPNPRTSAESTTDLPQRTLDWIDVGGERAVGDGWSSLPLLPIRGATETEIACTFQKGTPIHRCLFRVAQT